MNRRGFFGVVFGGIVARYLPKPNLPSINQQSINLKLEYPSFCTKVVEKWGENSISKMYFISTDPIDENIKYEQARILRRDI